MSAPRPYDLSNPAELARLFREVAGYLQTCSGCGTDTAGRRYALEALKKLPLPLPPKADNAATALVAAEQRGREAAARWHEQRAEETEGYCPNSSDAARHRRDAAAIRALPSQEQHPDDVAVHQFASALVEKMAASRAKGRSGWETCPAAYLQQMLAEHVRKGDPRDVACIAMMLWHLGASTTPPSASAGEVERLTARVAELESALSGVLPFMEAAESAGLVGDEGCLWPVEIVRAALSDATREGGA